MAANDVLSLTEAYRAINDKTSATAGTGPQDDRLGQLVTAISGVLDETIGPVVVTSAITEYHDGGRTFIRPRQTPLSSITTLKEATGASVTTLTAETFGASGGTYLLDQDDSYAHNCRIHRRSGGGDTAFLSGRRSVELVYVAGRAANTAAVDVRIKECASEILRRLNKREGGVWMASPELLANMEGGNVAPGFFRAVKPMIEELLHDEMKPVPVA